MLTSMFICSPKERKAKPVLPVLSRTANYKVMNITIEQAKLLKELSEGKKVPLSRLKARIFQQFS